MTFCSIIAMFVWQGHTDFFLIALYIWLFLRKIFFFSFYRHMPYPDRIDGTHVMGWLATILQLTETQHTHTHIYMYCIHQQQNIRVELKRSIKSIWCSENHRKKATKTHSKQITWLHEHESKCALHYTKTYDDEQQKKMERKKTKKNCNFCTDLFAFLIGFFSSSSDKSHKYETVCPFILNVKCNYSKRTLKLLCFVFFLFFFTFLLFLYMYKIHCSSLSAILHKVKFVVKMQSRNKSPSFRCG